MLLIENPSTDPAYNHALEEYLLRNVREDVFMVWQNVPTILIGRNQDARCEYDADYAEEKGIRVVRRLSGGGTIYCDLKNLQYTLIAPFRDEGENPFLKFAAPVVDALRQLGIDAEFTGRNDITVEGKKVSGNAQFRFENRVLHHGTLLFDVDREAISKALRPNPIKLVNKQIQSVASRIGTLSEYVRMDVRAFMEYLKGHFMKHYGIRETYVLREDELREVLWIKRERFDSPSWNLGVRYRFTHSYDVHHPFGMIGYRLDVDAGVIRHAEILGDFFGDRDVFELAQRLKGNALEHGALIRCLEGVRAGDYIHGMENEVLIGDMMAARATDAA